MGLSFLQMLMFRLMNSGVIRHQGRIHPGRSANPSQGTLIHSCNHTTVHYSTSHIVHYSTSHYRHRDSNQPRSMSLDCGRKPEHPEETHQARGEHANSTHTGEQNVWMLGDQP